MQPKLKIQMHFGTCKYAEYELTETKPEIVILHSV